ncbi:hypothetical protein CV_1492 [Chromobacterium violaceum ATCC 12472]|uniref:Uncharacterized protein n=1 Tax=Chromobacterium violaceum (strain ATCC 12472 / DSM 30191 / JCM 1249 / CCUG 213 / NBRC 12614 / NCIMB 9131 / NCTC 9757 / MK) TaxID=243365 RepID=Q7NXY4_CHRVO|nr:hypothetical protein CV_1492 [Chromobacterium violaceum ATCC 12472]
MERREGGRRIRDGWLERGDMELALNFIMLRGHGAWFGLLCHFRKPVAQSLHCSSPNWQYRLRATVNTN